MWFPLVKKILLKFHPRVRLKGSALLKMLLKFLNRWCGDRGWSWGGLSSLFLAYVNFNLHSVKKISKNPQKKFWVKNIKLLLASVNIILSF